ncbi:helix-turn-helix domain-containing protein [Dietzia kunjamensis]
MRREVVSLYEAGQTSRAVAEELQIGRTTVLKVLKQEGVMIRPQGVH